MLKFKNLRLAGFKSFVDGTSLPIGGGLTGVVGPNGCGKSNLVEGLRWVMGETSPKQMRSGGMEDVIFSGTSQRPARNIAEVTLVLDNSSGAAPAPWTTVPDIEVSRRIERDRGSTYRINGQEVRARDVQLLFADSSTGARSTAIVSQGRIGAIINAKPEQRRMILEEAAGITGLHSRRHEAELRLRAAETNLTRLDDVIKALDSQMQGLRKQSRQAMRYRSLQESIRAAQAHSMHLRWEEAQARRGESAKALHEAESAVAALTGRAGEAAARQAEAAGAIPGLRKTETEAGAAVSAMRVELGKLDEETRRVEAQAAAAETRRDQAQGDMTREDQLLTDAAEAVEKLAREESGLNEADAGESGERAEAEQTLIAARAAAETAEAEAAEHTRTLASEQARRDALESAAAEERSRLEQLMARAEQLDADLKALGGGADGDSKLAESVRERNEQEAKLTAGRAARDLALQAAENVEHKLETERAAAAAAEQTLAGLEAEERALAGDSEAAEADMFAPLINAVTVEPGFEAALAAAFGEGLDAPSDDPAPSHWRTLGLTAGSETLPAGVRPLAESVRGPEAIQRRLSRTGVVEAAEDGDRLQAHLAPGQRLVSRSGGLWRWDGFTVRPGARTAARAQLEQKNRLAAVRAQLPAARGAGAAAAEHAAAARLALDEAHERRRRAADTVSRAETALAAHAQAVNTLETAVQARKARAEALNNAAKNTAQDLQEARDRLEARQAERARLGDLTAQERALEAAQSRLQSTRRVLEERRGAFDTLIRAKDERARRITAITAERADWTRRKSGAEARKVELTERIEAADAEQRELAGRPAEIAATRETLAAAMENAEGKRRVCADALAAGESRQREADQALRAAEQALAEAREIRVRREGQVEQAEQALKDLAERIAEALNDAKPEDLSRMAGLEKGEDDEENEEGEEGAEAVDAADAVDAVDAEAVEERLQRLIRERDAMGPVNLRADHEAEELAEQINGLAVDRDDLTAAIEKLRGAIAELNKEGRERLLASFREVNRHFETVFMRLFGGGEAHLQLIETDDPLNSGLEIMASPPGKTLTSLSLLSGGEQAMTALSLLFAVFMTNPAPICVLDEVDAPLDDANVDRFCTLLEEMSQSGSAKFLVVTHHRMSMARMEHLYGVTMAERGVSQLVSVDMTQAEAMRATA
ncbi:MAG: chromosome segregation protein SMC [Rhodospirillales bacterium]